MEVADLDREEHPAELAQDRIADVPVRERHRPRGDTALEAVAHHEIGAVAQLDQEWHQIGEIIGLVGIAHDDVLTARRLDSAQESRAIAARRNWHESGALSHGDLAGTVRAAVVSDQDLAGYTR